MCSSKRQSVKEEDPSDQTTDLQVLRRREPEHFLLKVESFSDSEIEKYESDEFEVGGYKWRLVLYPKGDKKRNGSNHISLYLSISDTKNLPQGWEVKADFNLFVYNYVSEKYLTYKLASETRFNWLKTDSGFAQLISLDDFKKISNGYLFDDTCVFGAEVFVNNPIAKRQTLSIIKETKNNKFTWSVGNFSAFNDAGRFSKIFIIGDVQWRLQLYPKGTGKGKGKSISLFLVADEFHSIADAEYKLRIRNQLNTNHVEKYVSHMFRYSDAIWGYYEFMALSDVNDKSKGFVVNDTLLVEVEFIIATNG